MQLAWMFSLLVPGPQLLGMKCLLKIHRLKIEMYLKTNFEGVTLGQDRF